jgi:hypothetical protein
MQRYLGLTEIRPAVFWLIFGVCVAIPLLGGHVLHELGLEYDTPAGSSWEKLHPSTYLVVLGFGGWAYELKRGGKPILQALIEQPLAFAFLLASIIALVYDYLALGLPYTNIIESFIVPALLLYMVRDASDKQRRFLAACVHVLFIVNSTIGIYEFVSGADLIAPRLVEYTTTQESVDTSDWEVVRAGSLWGHPLSATLATGAYLLANFIMPAKAPFPLLRSVGFLLSLAALPGFGGRFSILLFILFSAYLGLRWAWTLWASNRPLRMSDWLVFAGILVAVATILIGNEAGYFDRFIDRFSEDDGSASTRSAAVDILMGSDGLELLLGDINGTLVARQVAAGTNYGIEVFWIAFLLLYGLLISLVVYPAMFCVIIQTGRDRGFPGAFVMFYFILAQSGQLGLTGKTTLFSWLIIICYVLFPRREALSRLIPLGKKAAAQ